MTADDLPKYGPHDPDTAPDTVAVLQAGRWFRVPFPRTVVVPRPPELVRQREQLNNLAAEAVARYRLEPSLLELAKAHDRARMAELGLS